MTVAPSVRRTQLGPLTALRALTVAIAVLGSLPGGAHAQSTPTWHEQLQGTGAVASTMLLRQDGDLAGAIILVAIEDGSVVGTRSTHMGGWFEGIVILFGHGSATYVDGPIPAGTSDVRQGRLSLSMSGMDLSIRLKPVEPYLVASSYRIRAWNDDHAWQAWGIMADAVAHTVEGTFGPYDVSTVPQDGSEPRATTSVARAGSITVTGGLPFMPP